MDTRPGPFALVVNPRAGGGRAQARLPEVMVALREGGAQFEVLTTRGPDDARLHSQEALKKGAVGVAVVGGDGTLNEVVNGFFDGAGEPIAPGAWLALLPFGTGGDFRRTLGVGADIPSMVTRMLWARPRPIDIGFVRFRTRAGHQELRAFVNLASFGISGVVDELVNRGPKWLGAPAFALATLRARGRYRPRPISLRIDGEALPEMSPSVVAIANGRYFGGGMQIAPKATVDDGLLDVVGLFPAGLRTELATLSQLYLGRILDQPDTLYRQGKVIEAEPGDWSGAIPLDIDGESPGTLPASFWIAPRAILMRG